MTSDAMRLPYVRALVFGRGVGVLGSQVLSVAVGWQVYQRTGSAWSLAFVGLAQFVPVAALFPVVGHVVDRYPRRSVALAAHALHASASLGLAWVAATGRSTAWIYAFLLLLGAARAFAAPAVRSILPQILRPGDLPAVNAWMSASFEMASVLGPVLGGLILWKGPPAAPYVASAIGQVVTLACLLRVPPRPAAASADPTAGVLAGLRFLRRSPILLAAVTLDLFGVLFAGAVALLPVFADDVLHVGPAGLGWLRAAPAAGACLMALATTRLRPWRRPGLVLLVVVVGFGLSTIGFGLSRSLPLSLAFLFLTGVFDSVSVVIRSTLEQVVTPDALRGRVAAVNFVFIGMSNELGAFESGAAAALVGPVVAVVGGGVASLLVVAAVALAWPALARAGPLHTLAPPGTPAVEDRVRGPAPAS